MNQPTASQSPLTQDGFKEALERLTFAYEVECRKARVNHQAAWVDLLRSVTQGSSWEVLGKYEPYRLWCPSIPALFLNVYINTPTESDFDIGFQFKDCYLLATLLRKRGNGGLPREEQAWVYFATHMRDLGIGVADPTDVEIVTRLRRNQLQADYAEARRSAQVAVERREMLAAQLRELGSNPHDLDETP